MLSKVNHHDLGSETRAGALYPAFFTYAMIITLNAMALTALFPLKCMLEGNVCLDGTRRILDVASH